MNDESRRDPVLQELGRIPIVQSDGIRASRTRERMRRLIEHRGQAANRRRQAQRNLGHLAIGALPVLYLLALLLDQLQGHGFR